MTRALLSLALLGALAPLSRAQLPPGFSDTSYVGGFTVPVAMAFAPDGRLFVAQKGGAIRVVQNRQIVGTFATLSVSTNSERGLLGIAFDPQFPTDPYLYVYYTTSSGSLNPPSTPKNRVSRVTVDGNLMEPGSELILLDNIPSDQGNHNAGCLRFAPDGRLFISTGDAGTTPSNGQNLGTLAGKILRINQDGTIPSSNPFYGSLTARHEIWAYGFRNPFRFSFRPGTSTPYIGDVGSSFFEEVNVGVPGGNYGWNLYEGPTNVAGFVSPAYYYAHTETLGASITGGCFVVGKRFPPGYDGSYYYGDYVRDHIRRLTFSSSHVNTGNFGFATVTDPVDFAEGPDGALYYVSLSGGAVRRISYKTTLTGLSLNPTSVVGTKSSTGTVTLDYPAPAAGALISLSSSSALATVPSSVRIAGGAKSASFTVKTSAASSTTTATIKASRLGVTKSATLTITPTPNAAFVSQSVPLTMKAGQSYAVSIRMRNTGPTTWTRAGGYQLVSYNPTWNTRWGINEIDLPSTTSVPPSGEHTFTGTVKAPSTPGTYTMQWRMFYAPLGTFGEPSASLSINVTS